MSVPHSHPHGKDWAVPLYRDLAPAVVVEAGPGAGMWSRALRSHHRGWWLGVEVWEPYVDRYALVPDLYDAVMVEDIRRAHLPVATDLIIAGDVLEHLPRGDAVALVESWKARPGVALLISTPIVEYHQGALEGNPHETHLWHPTHGEMLELVEPDECTVGDIVGAYWRGPR